MFETASQRPDLADDTLETIQDLSFRARSFVPPW